MKAIVFDGSTPRLADVKKPEPAPDQVLIKVSKAGICNTDLEIIKGYMPGFRGILGHEFFGFVEESPRKDLIGKRVTAEINCACGRCEFCKAGLGRHCPDRTVIGIDKRDGAFAEYIAVPIENVKTIPDRIPDDSAILIEPLAAALEILEQVPVKPQQSVLLLGDGKLAQLIAIVLNTAGCSLTVIGKHGNKLRHLSERGVNTILKDAFNPALYDIVIEASGSSGAFQTGLSCVKPRGIFVLKSTYAQGFTFNPASVVVNEITVIGSRCGRFEEAIRFLDIHKPDLSYLISKRFKLADFSEVSGALRQKDGFKVVLEMD